MKLTDKLIGYLNRVFDRGPQAVLALRIRYDGTMRWTIADGILTTTVTGGTGAAFRLDLRLFTVATLAANIAARPGYTVPFVDTTQIPGLLATVLLDGSGDQAQSNGDHLKAYTSTLWAYMEAKASELVPLRAAVDEALLQMAANTASGDWVDEHGAFYAVGRKDGESDAQYAARIVAEVGRARGNNVAIGEAVRRASGGDRVDVDDYAVETVAASGTKSFGLFDVSVYLDVNAALAFDAADANTRSVIEAMRDAGTHLRKLKYIRRTRLSTFAAGVLKYGVSAVVSPWATPSQQVSAAFGYGFSASIPTAPQVFFAAESIPVNQVVGAPVVARDAFLSYLETSVGSVSFESFAANTLPSFPLPPLPGASGQIVGTVYGDASTYVGPGAGRFNTTPGGNSYLRISGDADIEFSTPIAAFGFYGTDFGDFNGVITATFRNAVTAALTPFSIPVTPGTVNGNLIFWGMIDTGATYDKVTFTTVSTGATDIFGLDDVVFADAAQVLSMSTNPAAAGPAPVTVQFTDESLGAPTNWSWDFQNNGSIDSTLQNPTFTYTSPGVYSVALTASNSTSLDVETKQSIIVVSSGTGLQTYYGASPAAGGIVWADTPPYLARQNWTAAFPCPPVLEGFTTYGLNAPLPLSVFGGSATLTMSPGAVGVGSTELRTVVSGATTGRFNTTGAVGVVASGTWWQSAYNFEIAFTTPIRSFCTYITDTNDFIGQIHVRLTDTGGGTTLLPVPDTSGVANGGLVFFGFTDDAKQYTKVAFELTQGGAAILGFDDMAYATCVPTWGSAWPAPLQLPSIYYGENPAPSMMVSGQPVTKKAEFMSAITGASVVDFESLAVEGSPNTTPKVATFSGSLAYTATFTTTSLMLLTNINGDETSVTGRFDTTNGAGKWLEFRDRLTVTFSSSIRAFGFYGTDWGDFNGRVKARIHYASGAEQIVDVPHTVPAADGNLCFFGFIAPAPVQWVEFYCTYDVPPASGSEDWFGFDDLIIGTPI